MHLNKSEHSKESKQLFKMVLSTTFEISLLVSFSVLRGILLPFQSIFSYINVLIDAKGNDSKYIHVLANFIVSVHLSVCHKVVLKAFYYVFYVSE